jgi:hypothetical protein
MSCTSHSQTMIIHQRFSGPPGCGNGGYVSGRLAALLDEPQVVVSLMRPTPVDTPLPVEALPGGGIALMVGGQPAVTAMADQTPLHVPPTLTLDRALSGHRPHRHLFPGCFVCGPDCAGGLHIYPEKVGDGMCAAHWTPGWELADDDGYVRLEFLYAALDCPGAFAALGGVFDRPTLLGRFQVRTHRRPRADEPLTVGAWARGQDGRKHAVATALYDSEGKCLAASQAIWIELRQQAAA